MGDISKHFSRAEFACKCGCGLDNIDLRLMPILEMVRSYNGHTSLTPSSGCRCLSHNEKVQKENNPGYLPFGSQSKHLPDPQEEGMCHAVDVPVDDPVNVYNFLCSLLPGTYGIGLYPWGIHVDTRHMMSRWDYT